MLLCDARIAGRKLAFTAPWARSSEFRFFAFQRRYKGELFPIPKDLKHTTGSARRQILSRNVSSAEESAFRYTSEKARKGPRLPKTTRERVEAIDNGELEGRAELRNSVERQVNDMVPQSFGFATQEALQQFGPQHPDFFDFMPAYLKHDVLRGDAVRLFWDSYNGLLPPDPSNISITTPKGKMQHNGYGFGPRPQNSLGLAWHHLMFNTPIRTTQLLTDGTDTRFVPGPPQVWKHRLWAGGFITLHATLPQNTDEPQTYHMLERPVKLRAVGQDRPEKAFVTVSKAMHKIDSRIRQRAYTPEEMMRYLAQEPQYMSPATSSETENASKSVLLRGPVLEEQYTLCFLRDPPDFSQSATKVIKSSHPPMFSHVLTPNRHLLFCWSAVTYNAHLIHLDPTFAKEEYGAPNLLVHGPLTLFLILEWFQRTLSQHARDGGLSKFHLKSISYKNLQPLYVDEPMTFCARPTTPLGPGGVANSWDIWIEKPTESGVMTMAFKGEITVATEPLTTGNNPRQPRRASTSTKVSH